MPHPRPAPRPSRPSASPGPDPASLTALAVALVALLLGAWAWMSWQSAATVADAWNAELNQGLAHLERAPLGGSAPNDVVTPLDRWAAAPESSPPAEPAERTARRRRPASNDDHDPRLARRNQRLLRFANDADYHRFIELARGRSFDLESVPALRTVNVRFTDRDAFDRLLGDGPEPESAELNHIFSIPPIAPAPPEQASRAYQPFDNSALAFLGVQPDPTRGQGVTVAILDTGVAAHPTFEGSSIRHIDAVSPKDPQQIAENDGHGTAVASLVAGRHPQAPGVAPAADLLSVRVLGGDGATAFSIAQGIVSAADAGARVLNLSLGSSQHSAVVFDAIQYAQRNGALIVAASGNSGTEGILFPAAYPGVIAVTAVDATGDHMYFSNRGPQATVAAPALGVHAAWPGEKLIGFTGTSAAAPFVAGAVAALLSHDPSLSNDQITQLLRTHADDNGAPGHDPIYGHGVLNLDRLLRWNQPGIRDIAVSSLSAPPAEALSSETFVTIAIQNRGTEWQPTSVVTLRSPHYYTQLTFPPLEVGAVASERIAIPFPTMEPGATLQVTSELVGSADARASNNRRELVVRRPAPASADTTEPAASP